jgi:hypothetical protein
MTQESNLAGGLVLSKVAPAGLDRVLKKGGGLSLFVAALCSVFGDCSKSQRRDHRERSVGRAFRHPLKHPREAPISRFAAILGDSV